MVGHGGKPAMPHYSFKISHGSEPHTNCASECPNDNAAKNEAAGVFADMARDVAYQIQHIPDWQIEVANHAGKTIFKIQINAESK
jgi:hypothetical protein